MPDTVVVDLDGTLANIEHRRHLVAQEKPQWDEFYASCDKDTSNEWCREIMTAMSLYGYKVIIVSARRDTEEAKTREWLFRNSVTHDELVLLRKGNDSTPDTTLKKAWLETYGRDRILFVVDDRQKVVDMWRKEGVVCLQCYVWEEFKKKCVS